MDKPARIMAASSLIISAATIFLIVFIFVGVNEVRSIANDVKDTAAEVKKTADLAMEKASHAKNTVAEWYGTRDAEELRLIAREDLINARDDLLRKKEEYIQALRDGDRALVEWLKGRPKDEGDK